MKMNVTFGNEIVAHYLWNGFFKKFNGLSRRGVVNPMTEAFLFLAYELTIIEVSKDMRLQPTSQEAGPSVTNAVLSLSQSDGGERVLSFDTSSGNVWILAMRVSKSETK